MQMFKLAWIIEIIILEILEVKIKSGVAYLHRDVVT